MGGRRLSADPAPHRWYRSSVSTGPGWTEETVAEKQSVNLRMQPCSGPSTQGDIFMVRVFLDRIRFGGEGLGVRVKVKVRPRGE